VFYELGISYALNKRIILASESIEELPFDIRSRKIVVYRDLVDLESKLKDELIKILK
jgi:hypothetical protein